MISQRARYAFKALFFIARLEPGSAALSRDIASAALIPQAFLEQILAELKRAGLLASRRGKDGGYRLARSAETISMAEILRLIDGPVAPLRCLSRTAYRSCSDCENEAECTLRHVFADVFDSLLSVLEQRSLRQAIDRKEKNENQDRIFDLDDISI